MRVAESRHPLLREDNDLGPVDPDQPLDALVLHLKPTAAQQAELTQLLADQLDPGSPLYHHWITPKEYGERFGLGDRDLSALTTWLQGEGFTIQRVSNSRTRIFFSGTAAQAQATFGTPLRRFRQRDGEEHFANATDVMVPAALDGLVLALGGLDDVKPKALLHEAPPGTGLTSGSSHYLAPADVATIYDLSSIYSAGVSGSSSYPIAIVGQTSVVTADVTRFRTAGGLSTISLNTYLVPNSGSSTYVSSGDVPEAMLDIEWSSAVARSATINYVYTGGTSGYNAFTAFEYACDNPASVGNPKVISVSYGACEGANSKSTATAIEAYATQANASGITVVAASGDSGAAGCDTSGSTSHTSATSGLSVLIPSDYPEVTAVGGTEFTNVTSTYWNSTNDSSYGSAKSYIPETSWNDSGALGLLGSGGGVSAYFAKPSWQTGTGVPSNSFRNVPDVSFSASSVVAPYVICYKSTGGTQYCSSGFASSGGAYYAVGGTSASAPVFAGLVALLDQTFNSSQGNINSTLYTLAAGSHASSVFHDITSGDNKVTCTVGTTNCTTSPIGYSAGTGYDQVTGWGSIDGYNAFKYWPTTTVTPTQSQSPSYGAPPSYDGTFTFTFTSNRVAPAMTGTVTVYMNGASQGTVGLTASTNASGYQQFSGTWTHTFSAGTYSVYATYAGDTIYPSSSTTATTYVCASMAISPTSANAQAGGTVQFSATGGNNSYSWSIKTNSSLTATVDSTGLYTAGSTSGVTDAVKVADNYSHLTTSATVTVYPAIAISPSAPTVQASSGITFSASGGSGTSYTWSKVSAASGGSITTAGVYTAGSSTGTDVMQVTDSLGLTRTVSITVDPKLSISPSGPTVLANSSTSFTADGGSGSGYTWSVTTKGSGSPAITTDGGVYTAGASSGTDVAQVKDSAGLTTTATITVKPALVISGATAIQSQDTTTFTADGGSNSGYTWSLTSSSSTGPSISTDGGVYVAGTGTGTDTVQVKDSLNFTKTASITVYSKIAISPSAPTVQAGSGVTFAANGGSGTGYTWSKVSAASGGSITTAGVYAAGASTGTDVMKVTDSLGLSKTVSITVDPALAISPSTVNLMTGTTQAFAVSGGSGSGYAWTVSTSNSGGSITADGGVYTAGASTGKTDTIKVTDSAALTKTATVNVYPALSVTPGSPIAQLGGSVSLSADGGTGTGYAWSKVTDSSGGMSISDAGVYTAGSTTSGVSDTVKVTDSGGLTRNVSITVDPAIVISPGSSVTVQQQSTTTFTATGGTGAGYTWSQVSIASGGNVTSGGLYTAGSTSGTDSIKVTDSAGLTKTATITVDPKLVITPSAPTVQAQSSTTFTASGGSGSGYSWSQVSMASGGSITSGGVYTAGSSTGTDVVKVTDGAGLTLTASITVKPKLVITPSSVTVQAGGGQTFTASGGSGTGYTWSLPTKPSGGNITSGGVYTSGSTSGVIDVVKLTDSLGLTQTANVTVGAVIVISPSPAYVQAGQTKTFTASGGTGTGYTWLLSSAPSGGNITSGGFYTAGATAATDVVKVTDSANLTQTANIGVDATLGLGVPHSEVVTAQQQQLSASGGSGSGYTFTLTSAPSGATITSGGLYVAGTSSGTSDVALVTDSHGNTRSATIAVDAKLAISPATKTVLAGSQVQFSATGGLAPYSYSVSGGGGIDSTGLYTAGASAGTDLITVSDSSGHTDVATVVVDLPLTILQSARAVLAGGTVALSASGGTGAGQIWSFASGGNLSGATLQGAVYTAGQALATDTILLTDSGGFTQTAQIAVEAPLVVTPSTREVIPYGILELSASGGSGADYTFSLVTNTSGAFVLDNGHYNAGGSSGVDTLLVSDSLGLSLQFTVTVVGPIVITMNRQHELGSGEVMILTATGGAGAPYTWSFAQNNTGGQITAGGVYTAGIVATQTNDDLLVTDRTGNTADQLVLVDTPLVVSNPDTDAASGQTLVFTASGGTGAPFQWAFVAGANSSGGQIATAADGTGVYTAGATVGVNDLIKVTDVFGDVTTASIHVWPALNLDPPSAEVQPSTTLNFVASGGAGGPYTFSFYANNSGGGLNSLGHYAAGNPTDADAPDQIQVTDSIGLVQIANVTVDPFLLVSPQYSNVQVHFGRTLSVTGGSGHGYVFSTVSAPSGGAIAPDGTYIAGGVSGVTDEVQVADSTGATASGYFNVYPQLVIPGDQLVTSPGQPLQLSVTGGSGGGYHWSFSQNRSGGAITGSGHYTAGATTGVTDTVQVVDGLSFTTTASIVVEPALAIAPAAPHVLTGAARDFSATGGSGSGYTWRLVTAPSGGAISNAGHYTAGGTTGVIDLASVTDSLGLAGLVSIAVDPGLAISPAAPEVIALGSLQLSASGGSGSGYTWAFSRGGNISGGSLTAAGLFTAGAGGGAIDSVQVTDGAGNSAVFGVSIDPSFVFSPASLATFAQGSIAFSATGGSGKGYAWSMAAAPSGGSITSAGVYSAGATSGVTDTVRITDSLGASAQAQVAVEPAISVLPQAASVAAGGKLAFSATGGSGSGYAWTFASNHSGGAITPAGAYTAGLTSGVTDTLRVTDSAGLSAQRDLSVVPALVLTPASASVLALGQATFTAAGGVGSVTYSLTQAPSGGSITAGGVYTAGSTGGVTDVVQVADQGGNTATAQVAVFSGLTITPANPHTSAGGHLAFSTSVGSATWTLATNRSGGSITSGGAYIAGTTTGVADVVSVSASGQTATTTVQVDAPLSITPSSPTVSGGSSLAFSAAGGTGTGYTWKLSQAASGGAISITGAYVAGLTPGSDVVQVTDSAGSAASATVTVNPKLLISPSSSTVSSGASLSFTATGGSGQGYSWSLAQNGSGATLSPAGDYVAGLFPGVDHVRVTDSAAELAEVLITVTGPFTVSPGSPIALAPRGKVTFSASGGQAPYTYSVITTGSGGAFSGAAWTAGPTGSTDDLLQITDSQSQVVKLAVHVGPGVSIGPGDTVAVKGSSVQFSGQGGSGAGFVWSLASNESQGSIDHTTGAYTAGQSSGVDTVAAADSLGNSAQAFVTVVAPVSISVQNHAVLVGSELALTAAGGTGSGFVWSFSVNSSGGTVSAQGHYVAGLLGGVVDKLRVADSAGDAATVDIAVDPALVISPASPVAATGHALTFTASGGSGAEYSWRLVTNVSGGTLSSDGAYVAGSTPGTDVIEVSDSASETARANVQVIAALLVTETSPQHAAPRQSITLHATGGAPPLAWALVTNASGGTLDSGVYVAGTTGSVQDSVRVSDSAGQSVTLLIDVGAGVTVTPATSSVHPGETLTFTASGGSGSGYTFSLSANPSGATLGPGTGAYKAGATPGVTDTIVATDSLGNTARASVEVDPVVHVASAGGCSCNSTTPNADLLALLAALAALVSRRTRAAS